MTMTTTQPTCPECEGAIALPADVMQGEIVPCDDCGVELEVKVLEPLELTMAPEIQEDWGE